MTENGPGQQVAQELEASGILDKDFIATVDQVGMSCSWNSSPKELDDVIPYVLLAPAVCRYLVERWEVTSDENICLTALRDTAVEDTTAKRLIAVIRKQTGASTNNVDHIELKAGVYDTFVDLLLNTAEFENDQHKTALAEFEQNVRAICSKLQMLLQAAETRSRRDRLQKNVRLAVERFEKAHRQTATKADVERCLRRIDDACTGSTDAARRARENVIQLREVLDGEVVNAGEVVKLGLWMERFRKIWDAPWKDQKDNWGDHAEK